MKCRCKLWESLSALLPLRNPITGIAGCCARAASGQATAAPPRPAMNARRLTRNLVGSGEELRRDVEAERLSGFDVHDQLKLGQLLNR